MACKIFVMVAMAAFAAVAENYPPAKFDVGRDHLPARLHHLPGGGVFRHDRLARGGKKNIGRNDRAGENDVHLRRPSSEPSTGPPMVRPVS
jgi:hypothetical protein